MRVIRVVGGRRAQAGLRVRSERRIAVVDGVAVPYEVAGRGSPVALVHGLCGSGRWWRRTIAALAARHRVFVVDLPGFGALGHWLHSRFALDQAAHWLRGWMAAVGLERATLVGHSMGGYIALRVAAAWPELVERLVLLAPAGAPSGRGGVFRHALPLLIETRQTHPRFLPIVTLDALRAGPLTLWRAAASILAQDIRAELAAISTPTLLLWGERDQLVPGRLAATFRAALPNARLLTFAHAGHTLMYDHANEVNAALLAFLAGERVGE